MIRHVMMSTQSISCNSSPLRGLKIATFQMRLQFDFQLVTSILTQPSFLSLWHCVMFWDIIQTRWSHFKKGNAYEENKKYENTLITLCYDNLNLLRLKENSANTFVVRECLRGCVCELKEPYRLCGQEHFREGKKSQHRPLHCHQFKGLFSTQKKALRREKRRARGGKKEKDLKMCSKEKPTGGSSPLLPFSRLSLPP